MADFEVPFQQRGVDEGFGEFVAHAGFLHGAGGDVVVGPVAEGAALAFGVEGVVCDVGGRELELGFLLGRGVGGEVVGGKGVDEELPVLLVDFGWERGESGEDVEGYGKGELGGGSEGGWKRGAVELGGAVGVIFDDGGLERCSVGVLLVSDLEATYFGDDVCWERDVVVVLRFRVCVFDDHVDRLPHIAFFEIDGSEQIDILEDLRRFEGGWEDLVR